MTDLSPRIFLDTDIGPDCDDTAALAILLQLCREGRARLPRIRGEVTARTGPATL